jgi:hypothetical protein
VAAGNIVCGCYRGVIRAEIFPVKDGVITALAKDDLCYTRAGFEVEGINQVVLLALL